MLHKIISLSFAETKKKSLLLVALYKNSHEWIKHFDDRSHHLHVELSRESTRTCDSSGNEIGYVTTDAPQNAPILLDKFYGPIRQPAPMYN